MRAMKPRVLLLLLLSCLATLGRAQLATSPSTTEGPYYVFNSSQTLSTTWLVNADNDLTLVTGRTTRASGTRFLLSGTVVNTAGNPIVGATVEIWQTDNNGIYYHSGNSTTNRDQNFQNYGTATTDSTGAWSFRTVRPGLYTGRIRHFHYRVRLGGQSGTILLTSQFMFNEDRSLFTSDNVASPLVANGTIEATVLTPTSGVDSVDGTSALLATKQIVINYTGSAVGTSTSTSTSTLTLPAAATVTTGHAVSFTAAGGTSGTTYQWQVSTNNGSSWSNLSDGTAYSGTTGATLTVNNPTSALNGALYRVLVNGTATTSTLTLAVQSDYFPFPAGLAIDSAANLYVADSSTHAIGKVTSAGAVTTLAGTAGSTGTTDATGTSARFNQPNGSSSTAAGVVFVADTANATIRRIAADGTVTTFAGSTTLRGNTDGTGTSATFSYPVGVAQDSAGNLYVADATNHSIRKITSAGVVSTLAGGAGISGSTDGTGTAARFNYPTGVAVDTSGNVYVADTTNNTVRKITAAGVVTTLAGTAGIAGSSDGSGSAALFNQPAGLAVDSAGNVYVADTGNSAIRRITGAGVVSTFAGLTSVAGLQDGTGTAAWFNQPKALVLDSSGNLLVADTGNAALRKVTTAGVVTTVSLSTGTTTSTTTSTTTTTTTGTTGTTTSSSSSGGGGGGGAPSALFLLALAGLGLVRRLSRNQAVRGGAT